MSEKLIYILPVFGLVGLAYMLYLSSWVKKQSAGSEKMQKISGYIATGAMAFLKAEYRMLAVFVVIAGSVLGILSAMNYIPAGMYIVAAFVTGAVFSALAGNIGMRIATKANVRTAEAAKTSLPQAMKVAFRGGTVMGLGVAGLAVFGLSSIFLFLVINGGKGADLMVILETLAGFSLGAECIALFARVGGGIYTKAADVGADLVGKVEAGIPEDDPRNPATIADNVGDNVGDVAGMGADLFGSYVATMLAAMVLGNYLILQDPASFVTFNGMGPILMPVLIAGVGLLFSIAGTWVIKINNNEAKEKEVQGAFNLGNWGSLLLTAIASFFIIKWMLPENINMNFFGEGSRIIESINVFYAVLIGLAVGGLIAMLTEYYTAMGKKPVIGIIKNSSTGAATNIIAGLSLGMMSTFAPILLFAGAIWGAYEFAGFYGVSIAASAMMATTALQLAIDAFGPIADNAGGIAEMSELDPSVRQRTDILDAVGNTTAAVGKGFAIASAALTALALFAAYVTFTEIDGINIFKAKVLAALFIGAMIPVVFSAMAMSSVGKAAMAMVKEVRRQFKDIPGIMEGKAEPEYDKCVDISTKAALKEMMLPGILTISGPIIIGFLMGAEALGAYMAGVTVSGVLWAIFQNNAGGAWDNAKKSFEAGVEIDGKMTYKGSDAHKAAVTGDTVGDPFKDTSGPSMNILIKLTCLIGLVIAPILGGHETEATEIEKVGYSLGVNIASSVKEQGMDSIDANAVAKAFKDVFDGNDLDISEEESLTILKTYFEKLQAEKSAKANKANTAYLAENAAKKGVTTTASGLQYEVLVSGKGAKPTAADQVTMHYHGTLTDGTVFNSSVGGQPATLEVTGETGVPAGWTEALQLMSVGDKWRLTIPGNLAYGERGFPEVGIDPNATLIFEIELLGINK